MTGFRSDLFRHVEGWSLDFLWLHRTYSVSSTNSAWMVALDDRKVLTMLSKAGQIGSDSATAEAEFAAAMDGDPAARWRALEACRDYLRLVVRRSRWSKGGQQQATSHRVQNTLLDG